MRDTVDTAAIVKAPALGYSITANLGGDRQIVMQSFIDSEETLAVMHGQFDRAMALIDRQKAKYAIVDLKKELADLGEQLAQGVQDLADVDLNFEKAQASLDVQIGELQRQGQELHDDAYQRHVASGRVGRFKPVGHTKASIDVTQTAIRQVEEQKVKNEAERAQHRQGFLISQQRREARVAFLHGEIAALEAVIAGG